MSEPRTIPALSLVVLVGPSGSGKSTFASRHFKPTEVLSSDYFRGLVRDDETSMAATADAFELLHFVVRKRLAAGLLTVIDATNVQKEVRRALLALAREYHAMTVAIVLDLPMRLCIERNAARPDRPASAHYVRKQFADLRRSTRRDPVASLRREGFRHVHVFDSPEAATEAEFARVRLWTDRRDEHGPFDIVGDVHGCVDELLLLLQQLGWQTGGDGSFAHPEGRKLVFLGDLVDRGPRNLDVLQLVMRLCHDGAALCVPGNHDLKFLKWLQGRKVKIGHGLERTIAEVEALAPVARADFTAATTKFLDGLISHFVLDGGRLVVAHAGMKQAMQGRASGAVREFALYGETTGEVDDYGLPVRHDWAQEYRGDATVVYGHTPAPEAEWLNRTICIDTGCVFGGKLTALRWPEQELVAVAAARVYCEPVRPLAESGAARAAQHEHDDVLDLADFTGKRVVSTRLLHNIGLQADENAAAIEAASRFGANPRWVVYLPPTMSPPATSALPGLLEHPAEALEYYRDEGIDEVVCEEKHMGSRAVVVVCRDAAAAARRFGVVDGSDGAVLSRTGREFFADAPLQRAFLDRLRRALSSAGFWQRFGSDWFVLDCELMPWSAKAQELLRSQYAAVGAAAVPATAAAVAALAAAAGRVPDLAPLLQKYSAIAADAEAFVAAYRRYCWPVHSLDDYRLAPFHLLAAEDRVFADQPNDWHMTTLAELSAADPDWLVATSWRLVDLRDAASCEAATAWWTERTAAGGEGMVVKPRSFIARGKKRFVQPAVKCRGREYLRIIYGPNYTAEVHLTRLRERGLSTKRALAQREFALGLEALERFVRREPLRRVHECTLGVLALESEPVDPRL